MLFVVPKKCAAREARGPVGDWRGVSGFRAWERLGGHQLDRFAFVVQNDSQDRFAAAGGHASLRDDGVGLFQYSIDGIYLILI